MPEQQQELADLLHSEQVKQLQESLLPQQDRILFPHQSTEILNENIAELLSIGTQEFIVYPTIHKVTNPGTVVGKLYPLLSSSVKQFIDLQFPHLLQIRQLECDTSATHYRNHIAQGIASWDRPDFQNKVKMFYRNWVRDCFVDMASQTPIMIEKLESYLNQVGIILEGETVVGTGMLTKAGQVLTALHLFYVPQANVKKSDSQLSSFRFMPYGRQFPTLTLNAQSLGSLPSTIKGYQSDDYHPINDIVTIEVDNFDIDTHSHLKDIAFVDIRASGTPHLLLSYLSRARQLFKGNDPREFLKVTSPGMCINVPIPSAKHVLHTCPGESGTSGSVGVSLFHTNETTLAVSFIHVGGAHNRWTTDSPVSISQFSGVNLAASLHIH